MVDHPLHPVSRLHLEALAGPLGLWQHAEGTIANEAFGYCTDDVARSLLVDLLHSHELGWEAVRESAWRSLRFMSDAFVPATGRFRNFRAQDGSWLEADGSDDCQGRAMHTLGVALAEVPEATAGADARTMFVDALPAARGLTALRAISSALLGCGAALDGGLDGETQSTFEDLAAKLRRAFVARANDPGWPWPEPTLTYENALLPEALIAAGVRLDDPALVRTGLRAIDWLVSVQTAPEGWFSPIGSTGWSPSGGARSRFDQQPIEATSMILAAAAAFSETGDERYSRAIEKAYGWFLGDNELGLPLADPATGGCHDGLTRTGVNLNKGAESTLMWQIGLERVRVVRGGLTVGREAPASQEAGVRWAPTVRRTGERELFLRHPSNPIITADQLPYRANSVFNPGAGRVGDETVLLLRVEDLRGISQLQVARSFDGVTEWRMDSAPLIAPQPEWHPEEIWGCEDPRLTWLPERAEWAIAYTAYSRLGPLVSLAVTTDFRKVLRLGPVMPPEDKDAALFPRRIGDRWVMIHRPSPLRGLAHMWISQSPDLRHWGDHELLLEAREGAWWDAGKIGLGPPPLETPEGWLLCYHGVHSTASGPIYRIGLALLDLDDPRIVLRRTTEWVLAPTAPYERSGDVNKVVFPTGWVLDDVTGVLSMYYGAGDSSIALATASLADVLEHLRHTPLPQHRRASDMRYT